MYKLVKLAAVVVGLLVLVGCADGSVTFQGEYDPESGAVKLKIGDGTATPAEVTVQVDTPADGSDGTTPPPEQTDGDEAAALITIDPGDDPLGFLAAIPSNERECLARIVGVDKIAALLASDSFPEGYEEVFLGCFSEETVRRVMFGMLAREAGDLGGAAIECLVGELQGVNLLEAIANDTANVDFVLMPGAALNCLSHEQLASIGIIGDGEGDGPNVEQLRCLLEHGDSQTLALLGAGIPAPAAEALLAKCGIAPDGDGEVASHEISPEHQACAMEAIGEAAYRELVAGNRQPTPDELRALSQCVYSNGDGRDGAAQRAEERAARETLGREHEEQWRGLDREFESAWRALEDEQNDQRHTLEAEHRQLWDSLKDEQRQAWDALEEASEAARRAAEEEQHSAWDALEADFEAARQALDTEQQEARVAIEAEYEAARDALQQEAEAAWRSLDGERSVEREELEAAQRAAWDALDTRFRERREALESTLRSEQETLERDRQLAWQALDEVQENDRPPAGRRASAAYRKRGPCPGAAVDLGGAGDRVPAGIRGSDGRVPGSQGRRGRAVQARPRDPGCDAP